MGSVARPDDRARPGPHCSVRRAAAPERADMARVRIRPATEAFACDPRATSLAHFHPAVAALTSGGGGIDACRMPSRSTSPAAIALSRDLAHQREQLPVDVLEERHPLLDAGGVPMNHVGRAREGDAAFPQPTVLRLDVVGAEVED